MSKLILERLTMSNFMGSESVDVSFNETTTLIYGNNGVGKTRIEDAFNWCLFGKNSQGVSQFHIKNTIDKEMHKADHEVVLYLKRDGFSEVLKRIYKVKYDKMGNYDGNEQDLYWNNTPLKLREFNMKVDSLIRNDVFKTITNVNYFNSLNWSVRRDILIDIVGGYLSDEEVANGDKDFENLLVRMDVEKKSLKDLEREVKDTVKKLEKDIEEADPKIKEILRNIPENLDWAKLESEIENAKKQIAIIDEKLQNRNATVNQVNKERDDKQKELHSLTSQLNELVFQTEQSVKRSANSTVSEKSNLQDTVLNTESVLRSKKSVLESKNNEIESLTKQLHGISAKWVDENKKIMPEVDDKCPTCKQDLPLNEINEKRSEISVNWNNNLLAFKTKIESEGKAINSKIKEAEALLPSIEDAINIAKQNVDLANEKLANYIEPDKIDTQKIVDEKLASSFECSSIKLKMEELKVQLGEQVNYDTIPEAEVTELKETKVQLQILIDTDNQYLGTRETIKQNNSRILQLESDRKTWSNQLSDLKGTEFIIKSFGRAKISALEERINSKFDNVTFKMFDEQVNGDLSDTCETVLEGRPYEALNTADKINAGLDIINTLSNHYSTYAPIFIDNRESVVKIIPVQSQTINMIVSGEDKTLRVA